MSDPSLLSFSKRPSELLTFWKVLRSGKKRFRDGDLMPRIHASRKGLSIDMKHVKAFNDICDTEESPHLHLLYPFTLVYPYIMRILTHEKIPVSLFEVLNTRNSIVAYRKIGFDEILDVSCRNSDIRRVHRGLEVDIVSEITSRGKKVWENTTTYFMKRKSVEVDPSFVPPKLTKISNDLVSKEWYFPARYRFRFSRVSGDGNGIHFVSGYARIFGFERDFAQPIRVVAKCIDLIPEATGNFPLKFDFFLKGPVYYEKNLSLIKSREGNGNRFDLYSEGNNRPLICGHIYSQK